MIMGCVAYRNGHPVESDDSTTSGPIPVSRIREVAARSSDDGTFAWIGLLDPTEIELEVLGESFDIHPLALEDANERWERPKIDIGSETLTVVLQAARYDEAAEIVHFGQIAVLAGPNYVVAVRHGEAVHPVNIRQAMEAQPEWLAQGPGAVLHAIIDTVAESYGPVIAGVTDDIEEVESDVFSDDRSSPTQRIYELKREVIQFAKAVGPLVNVLRDLATIEHPLVSHELRKYFSDIGDDVQRTADQNTAQRELLTSALEANMTQVSIKQNEDMRRISAWGAILAVPTMISGVYGMNFQNMPELGTTYGYFVVVGLMLTSAVVLYTYFKKIGWL